MAGRRAAASSSSIFSRVSVGGERKASSVAQEQGDKADATKQALEVRRERVNSGRITACVLCVHDTVLV